MSDTPVTQAPVTDTPGTETAGTVTVDPAGVGPLLRAAREAQGLSTGAIAVQLNLNVRTVEALEQDDHRRLPAPIFVRGYLRNYARLVGVAEDRVLEAYQAQAPTEPAPRSIGLPRRRRLSLRAPRIPWTGLFTLLLLGALGLLAWEFGPTLVARFSDQAPSAEAPAALTLPLPDGDAADSGDQAPSVATDPLDLVPPPTPLQTPTTSIEEDGGVVTPLDEFEPVLPPEAGMEPDAPPVTEADTLPDAAAAALAEPPVTAAPASVPAAPEEVQLELHFTDDSWVEINAADGTRLLYGLMRKDQRRSVAGQAPLRVLLGNAQAVELQVDGVPFDLAPHTREAVARFRLDADR
ncbi:MAG: helix-turn-helix domain-containing protein [Lysobacteraceae bacterium]